MALPNFYCKNDGTLIETELPLPEEVLYFGEFLIINCPCPELTLAHGIDYFKSRLIERHESGELYLVEAGK